MPAAEDPTRGRVIRALLTIALVAGLLIVAPHAGADPSSDDVVRPESTLRWTSCTVAPGAQCATITVPKDWARPGGATYRISVARVKASDPARRIGVLMYNPGGPGSNAVSNLSWVLGLLPPSVRSRFDVVAVDPRGVGGSQPYVTSCTGPKATPPATGPVDWAAWTREFVAANAKANRACLKANRDVAGSVGTWQIIRDLDAVREQLGERTITFWGMSYGSTVGRAYAQAFPSRVRALLLDGSISPLSSIESWAREHTWDDRLAITTMFAELGPTYQKAHARVMAELERRSLVSSSGQRITRWTVGRALIAWASFHSTWGAAGSLVLRMDTALFAKKPADRRAAKESAASMLAGTTPTGQSGGLTPQWTYVNCSDFHDRPSVATLTALAEQGAARGGTAVGMAVLREGVQCAGLPRLGRPLESMTTPLTLRTPPIVANALGDNRTPWSGARETARAFTGARLVRYAGTHHIVYGRTTSCVDKPITRYLLTAKLPRHNVYCPI